MGVKGLRDKSLFIPGGGGGERKRRLLEGGHKREWTGDQSSPTEYNRGKIQIDSQLTAPRA